MTLALGYGFDVGEHDDAGISDGASDVDLKARGCYVFSAKTSNTLGVL